MKKLFLILPFIFVSFLIFGVDSEDVLYQTINKLNFEGNYTEAVKILEDKFAENKNDIRIAWLIAQETFFITEITTNIKERVKLYSKSIQITEPFFNNKDADKSDMVNLTFWYAVNYALKIKDTGLLYEKSGAKLIDKVFKLTDKCIEIDPEYAQAYSLKGKFYGAIPAFLGGNKVKMEINYALALKYAKDYERLLFLYDTANSLSVRKWTVADKISEAKKRKVDVNTLITVDKDDLTLANEYINEIINSLSSKADISFREKMLLNDTNALLQKNSKQ